MAAEADDDIPWITVDNLAQVQAHDSRFASVPDERTTVACLTTDYAMQSVLMQMGLKLLSVDGMVLRSIKHWVRIASRTQGVACSPHLTPLRPPSAGAPLLGLLHAAAVARPPVLLQVRQRLPRPPADGDQRRGEDAFP